MHVAFGMALDGRQKAVYSYYIVLALVGITILVTTRLKNSRIGRAWMALREDEIACVAMGVDMARTKLSAYALGAFWAGLVGVIFAAMWVAAYIVGGRIDVERQERYRAEVKLWAQDEGVR